MKSQNVHVNRYERGSFLLEALIAILIVAFGILGSVGLVARSMQNVNESKYRGEAAYLVSGLIGSMWVADKKTATLDANFGDKAAGPGYVEFKTLVAQRLPGALDPVVTVSNGPTPTSSIVDITVQWQPPNESLHSINATATIGANK